MFKLVLSCLGFFVLFNFLAITAKAANTMPVRLSMLAPTETSSGVLGFSDSIDLVKEDMFAQGLCDIQAIAFSNAAFKTQANAKAKCDELVSKTGAVAADCKVVRLNNGQFRAQFRKVFQQNQQVLAILLQDVTNFIQDNNIFGDNQLKVQLAVSDGCG